MTRFSPKIEIINHFDKLINKGDIDIELSLEKYNEQEIFSQFFISSETDRRHLAMVIDARETRAFFFRPQ